MLEKFYLVMEWESDMSGTGACPGSSLTVPVFYTHTIIGYTFALHPTDLPIPSTLLIYHAEAHNMIITGEMFS